MQEQIQLLAKLLVDEGLAYAFGVTGSGPSLALITELESYGVRYYPAAHEASAAIMAGAVCRAGSTAAVSISIKGPGVTNMLPGIAHNYFENNPALSISEAFGAGVPSYRRHKRLDHGRLLSSIVKGMASLEQVDRQLPGLLRAARKEVPGPVHLDLCMSEAEPATILSQGCDTQSSDPAGRDEILRRLRLSEQPVLIVGSLATRRSWKEKLASVKVPVFTTVSAKGVLDESLPQSAGIFTGEGKEIALESHLFAEADLILGIALRNTEVLSPKPFGKPTILLDEVDEKLTDGFQPDTLLPDADSDLASCILDELRSKSWGMEKVNSLRRTMRGALLHGAWLPSVCFEVLNGLGFPYALVLDTGSFCTIGEHLWEAGPHRFFMGSSNGRTMGVGIPSGLGTAICKPGLPVFCVVGDGGMHAYPADLKLSVEEQLPICFVFMTDGLYGSVACVPQSRTISPRAFTVLQPSWHKAAAAMGCEAYAVNSESSFAAVVEAWKRKGPLFVEANFDPKPYASMTGSLR